MLQWHFLLPVLPDHLAVASGSDQTTTTLVFNQVTIFVVYFFFFADAAIFQLKFKHNPRLAPAAPVPSPKRSLVLLCAGPLLCAQPVMLKTHGHGHRLHSTTVTSLDLLGQVCMHLDPC